MDREPERIGFPLFMLYEMWDESNEPLAATRGAMLGARSLAAEHLASRDDLSRAVDQRRGSL